MRFYSWWKEILSIDFESQDIAQESYDDMLSIMKINNK